MSVPRDPGGMSFGAELDLCTENSCQRRTFRVSSPRSNCSFPGGEACFFFYCLFFFNFQPQHTFNSIWHQFQRYGEVARKRCTLPSGPPTSPPAPSTHLVPHPAIHTSLTAFSRETREKLTQRAKPNQKAFAQHRKPSTKRKDNPPSGRRYSPMANPTRG